MLQFEKPDKPKSVFVYLGLNGPEHYRRLTNSNFVETIVQAAAGALKLTAKEASEVKWFRLDAVSK